MPYRRTSIEEFSLANNAYTNAKITFYTIDATTLLRTDILATLYDAPSGTGTLPNPYTLDGDGKFLAPVYIDVPVIAVTSESEIASHSTGIIYPVGGGWRGTWITNTYYQPGDLVTDGANGDNTDNIYAALSENLSGVWLTDLGNGLWQLALDVQSLYGNNYIATDGTSPTIPPVNNSSVGGVAFGNGATVGTGADALAFGKNASATGVRSLAFLGGSVTGVGSFAYGTSTTVQLNSSIAIGTGISITGTVGLGHAVIGSEGTQIINGYYNGAVGGNTNTFDGVDSCGTAGGSNYTFSSASINCGGAGGYGNTADAADYVGFIGGNSNEAQSGANASGFVGGQGNTSAAPDTALLGGGGNLASGDGSIVSGYGAIARHNTDRTHSSGNNTVAGDSQVFDNTLRGKSSGTATIELLIGGTDRLVLPDQTTWGFDLTIVGRRTNADDFSARFKRSGCIDRNTGAATTTLVGTIDTIGADKNDSTYTCTITADTTNGSLKVEVTGATSHDISWTAHAIITETIG